MCLVVKFDLTQNKSYKFKSFVIMKTFIYQKTYLNIYNIFVLLNAVSYLKLNFKLKIVPKMFAFINLEEIRKTLKKRVATLF